MDRWGQHRSANVVSALRSAQRDGGKVDLLRRGIRRMVEGQLFRERPLPAGPSAILCSEWLSDGLVAAGTRGGGLLLYDVLRRSCRLVPPPEAPEAAPRRGIFGLARNPCGGLLATSGLAPNDLLVYSIPDLQPVCLGQEGHGSHIYGLKWVDEELLLSGAADGTLSLWRVSQKEVRRHQLDIHRLAPLAKKWCKMCGAVRALEIQSSSRLVALSDNFLHVWDLDSFRQVSCNRLPLLRNMRVMAHCKNHNLYVIGSSSHLTLLDGSSLAILRNVVTLNQAKLSLSVQGDILSYCTGHGSINFFDLVAGRLMDCSMAVCHDSTSIYTHTYDWSGTRMFLGGASFGYANSRSSAEESKSYAALLQ